MLHIYIYIYDISHLRVNVKFDANFKMFLRLSNCASFGEKTLITRGAFGNDLDSPHLQQFFIKFTLSITQLVAQYIPLLCYTSLPSPWKLPDGFTEPFFSGEAIPLMDK